MDLRKANFDIFCLDKLMGCSPGKKAGLGELVNIGRQALPSSQQLGNQEKEAFLSAIQAKGREIARPLQAI